MENGWPGFSDAEAPAPATCRRTPRISRLRRREKEWSFALESCAPGQQTQTEEETKIPFWTIWDSFDNPGTKKTTAVYTVAVFAGSESGFEGPIDWRRKTFF